MARFASVLAVVFHMTLAAVVCEEASFTSDRTERLAAEEWTDLALARLPRDAAVVVRSPDLAWRLWSAQRVEGQRPDVLLVASPLLVRSSGLARLLPHGAEVAPLLRDLTLTGSASEFGLSVLADARPLRVELDAAWDEQMLGHVMVDGPWLRFDPEALGSSDRPADGTSALSAEARIAAHVRGGARRDQVSAEVLGRTLKEQTTALALLAGGATPLTARSDMLGRCIDYAGRTGNGRVFSALLRAGANAAARLIAAKHRVDAEQTGAAAPSATARLWLRSATRSCLAAPERKVPSAPAPAKASEARTGCLWRSEAVICSRGWAA
jgi:hypothetical protein